MSNYTEIIICDPKIIPKFGLLCFVPFFHMTVPFIGAFFSFYKNKYFLFLVTFSSQMLGIITINLQKLIRDPRPDPFCTPIFYSQYGLPDEAIVIVTNTAISILFYKIYANWLEVGFIKKPKKKKKKKKSVPKKMITLVVRGINFITVLFFIFVYPFLLYCFYLCTLKQAVLSLLFSIVATTLICVLLLGALKIIK